ncbi:MAG: ABC transporter permease [Spirochaetota bacterium]
MLKYLIEKEFTLLFRNKFLPRLILLFPCFALLIFPWAASFEIKNINLCVVDNDHSSYSRRLASKASSSGYFRLADITQSRSSAMERIEAGDADIILEIPSGFERSLMRDGSSSVMISADSVNGTKGGLGSAYLSGIVSDFADELREQAGSAKTAAVTIVPQNRFNPHLSYKVFMVPALMVMLLTMLCGFLPALNIVGEKEAGTMEQINVSPVHKFTFILSKLIPYWIIGFVVLSIGFVIAFLVYGLVPDGYFGTIYLFAGIYILTVSGLGLVISNYSSTMQQAMFVMYFFMVILILMSGLFTPVASMPGWAQYLAAFNPLKYFVEVMRAVYLKGSGFADLLFQAYALSGFAVFFNTWAVLSYKKSA